LAGCGSSATPTASAGTSLAKSSAPKKAVAPRKTSPYQWHVVGTLAAQDTVAGKEPGVHHLWLLTQLPATANHEAEYVGQSVSTTSKSLTTVTPPFLPPGNRSETAWGRTAQGSWWITFVGQNSDTVRTAVWSTGHQHWTRLPNVTIPSGTNPTVPVIRGRSGHGWLVSEYDMAYDSSTNQYNSQTTVYTLLSHGWQEIHAFPVATSHYVDSFWNVWTTPGPTPGTLYVRPEGLINPVLVSRGGVVLKTLPLPHALATHWSQWQFSSPLDVVMSNSGVSYAADNSLWQWQGLSVHSLIPTGSTLASDGYTWQGLWDNQPVVSDSSTSALVLYHQGQWIPANVLARPGSHGNPLWKDHTLWSISNNTGKIWTKTLSSADLP
jgi:hypothetical protein